MKTQRGNNTRVIIMIVGMLIIMSTFIKPALATTTFTDLEKVQAWAGEAIEYFVAKGVIEGIGNHKFNPTGELTRGEAAKIIALTLGLDVDMNEKASFDDTKHHWSSPYVHALQSQVPGVITGFPEGTFQPNHYITREQMAKMLVLAYTLEKDENVDIEFPDVSGWAKEYITILASHGVISGKISGMFAPKDHITRAEATVFIHRIEIPYYRFASPLPVK